MIMNILNKPLGLAGFKLIKSRQDDVLYLHKYGGGYDEYKRTQIFHNKRKLDEIWADETTLATIRDHLLAHHGDTSGQIEGICHGARNGFEVSWFNEQFPGKVIGTDISETATSFDNMVVWDFHDRNEDWVGRFDFVFTNSLDQAMDPQKALLSWYEQLKDAGFIYIEHTMNHSAKGASDMDPFGAHPMCMPYLFFEWARDALQLADILHVEEKQNNKKRAWVFVLKKKTQG